MFKQTIQEKVNFPSSSCSKSKWQSNFCHYNTPYHLDILTIMLSFSKENSCFDHNNYRSEYTKQEIIFILRLETQKSRYSVTLNYILSSLLPWFHFSKNPFNRKITLDTALLRIITSRILLIQDVHLQSIDRIISIHLKPKYTRSATESIIFQHTIDLRI